MTQQTLNGVVVECITGDIARQADMQCVVNAANAELRIGGGVAGALHRAAGPGLEAECEPLAPIAPGEAVITGAHALPNDHVIHCLGPVYGIDEPSDALLAACHRRALELAEQHRIARIALPAISTGAFGYPLEAAADEALRTTAESTRALDAVEHIRFVLFGAREQAVYARSLARYAA
ncbi:Appr-1-p processing protein [Salinisphaera orenii MK-B5]|uniref:Appr-1-p processing protein n=1 Tax=Salinisphaera orenii MK-B5 TaxID=856730 RepID=A0A423PY54_9GAMM|nr:macro domain-containing protein [Salinisphaera orenii]ROO30512.1 Appr-1-p processing protein [Salinisphaera orenii MK-B5]